MLLEWMNEKPRKERLNYKNALKSDSDIPKGLPKDSLIRNAYDIVKQIRWETEVEPFVLPAVEMIVSEKTEGKKEDSE